MGKYRDMLNECTENMVAIVEKSEGLQTFLKAGEIIGADGAIDALNKELITLAIGISVRCDACIVTHVEKSLQAGATLAQIEEVAAICTAMQGGPGIAYGSTAVACAKEFIAEGK